MAVGDITIMLCRWHPHGAHQRFESIAPAWALCTLSLPRNAETLRLESSRNHVFMQLYCIVEKETISHQWLGSRYKPEYSVCYPLVHTISTKSNVWYAPCTKMCEYTRLHCPAYCEGILVLVILGFFRHVLHYLLERRHAAAELDE